MTRFAAEAAGAPTLAWEGRPRTAESAGVPAELVVTERSLGAMPAGMLCAGDNPR